MMLARERRAIQRRVSNSHLVFGWDSFEPCWKHFLFVADVCFEFQLHQVNYLSYIFYLNIHFTHYNFRFYNMWIYSLSHSATKIIKATCYHLFYFDLPSSLLACSPLASPARLPLTLPVYTANTLLPHIYHCFTVTCFNGGFVSTFECRWGHVRAAGEAVPAKKTESNAGNVLTLTSPGYECYALLTLPTPLIHVFLCTSPVHPGCDRPRCPSLRHRETTDPGCSSSGRREPGPGWLPLPLRILRSSRSSPATALLLSMRQNVTLWSSGTSVLR